MDKAPWDLALEREVEWNRMDSLTQKQSGKRLYFKSKQGHEIYALFNGFDVEYQNKVYGLYQFDGWRY